MWNCSVRSVRLPVLPIFEGEFFPNNLWAQDLRLRISARASNRLLANVVSALQRSAGEMAVCLIMTFPELTAAKFDATKPPFKGVALAERPRLARAFYRNLTCKLMLAYC